MDMHTKELRAAGENEQRIYLLSAWREALATTLEASSMTNTNDSRDPRRPYDPDRPSNPDPD